MATQSDTNNDGLYSQSAATQHAVHDVVRDREALKLINEREAPFIAESARGGSSEGIVVHFPAYN